MPQAAIAPLAAWIGKVVASVAVAKFVASVVVYAAVGAVIGGVSAAVMGGDIGKGVLYGAIGGAVSGGIAALSAGGGVAGGSAGGALQKTTMTTAIDSGGRGLQQLTVAGGAGASGAGAAGGAAGGLAPVLAQGALGVAGSMLAGAGEAKENEKMRAYQSEEAEKAHQRHLETIAANQSGASAVGGSSDALEATKLQLEVEREKMADARNQWNQSREDALAKVSTQRSALAGIRASRDSGHVQKGEPGIDRQGNKDIPGLFGDDPQEDDMLADDSSLDPLRTEEEERLYA